MPIAVVTFQFDPYAHLFGDLTVRWGTLALAGVIVVSLMLAGLLARSGGLRPDDVAFVAVGIVPGAVVGGRLGFLILHAGFYGSAPDRLLDPSVGGLELALGVVGGFVTGSYVASLLGAPVGRWLHIAAAPLLLGLGAGKLTMVLTGAGQGQPGGGDLATTYLGPGPWGSLVPALPSQPAQIYEGIATLAILASLVLLLMLGAFHRRDGRLFFVAVGAWAVARAIVSTTWRDPTVVNGWNAGGLIAIAVAVGSALALVIVTVRGRGITVAPTDPAGERSPDDTADVVWPDPEARPRF